MRAISASTLISDPYRAGMALGEELRAISPEVVFLFGTVHYGETTELLDGSTPGVGTTFWFTLPLEGARSLLPVTSPLLRADF